MEWRASAYQSTDESVLVGFGGVDHLVELVNVGYFGKRLAGLAADDIDSRGVVDADAGAEVFVGVDLGGQLALRVDGEGKIDFMVGGEFFGEGTQVAGKDFHLVLEDVVAIVVAELLGVSVEVAGIDGRFI